MFFSYLIFKRILLINQLTYRTGRTLFFSLKIPVKMKLMLCHFNGVMGYPFVTALTQRKPYIRVDNFENYGFYQT